MIKGRLTAGGFPVMLSLCVLTSFVFAQAGEPVDFNRDIRPLLSSKCFACHGPDEEHREASLRLDLRDHALVPTESGKIPIVPGKVADSELLARITSQDESLRMPPAGKDNALSPDEIAIFDRWIAEGAPYAKHWSLVPPTDSSVALPVHAWSVGAIDERLWLAMQSQQLDPSPDADRYQLLRRLTLDLTGLPPTLAEMDAFAVDSRFDAHERLVDRLLASPALGERWARVWLDLARYADSSGYASDPLRKNIWPYRDWVIESLNGNKPYDDFTVEQIAGDLLPNATAEQKLATAFHRNTMTNTEGGTDDEEFRIAAAKDRAKTTIQVWMGLTLGCAECHNHKYDPITQKEYYQVFAAFNQTEDADLPSEAPTMPAYSFSHREDLARIEEQIAEWRASMNAPSNDLSSEQRVWEESLRSPGRWRIVTPDRVIAESETKTSIEEDQSVFFPGPPAPNDTYTWEASLEGGKLTALRLDVLPDHRLPQGGPGRAADGNFVLSKISVEVADERLANAPSSGKFLRIELPDNDRILSMAEVQVVVQGANIAGSGTPSQSSVAFEGEARRAIDGNTDGDYYASNSVTHTEQQAHPWWELDLGSTKPVEKIVVWNRTDGGVGERLNGALIKLLDADRKEVWSTSIPNAATVNERSTSSYRSTTIAKASATHSQAVFNVQDAVDPKDLKKNGWAIGPHINAEHAAWFTFAEPTLDVTRTRIRVRLLHDYTSPGYLMGRFRISVSDDLAQIKRAEITPDILSVIDKPANQRSDIERTRLAEYYRSIAPRFSTIREQIAQLEKSRPTPIEVPIMKELPPDRRRRSTLMIKGNFLQPGDEVQPGVLSALDIKAHSPVNRLALARWIVDPANPLTARVAVNRIWSRLFGQGIVLTEEDFGTQGDLPTHPELLDALATDFVRLNWDTKRLIRSMVTTRAYRQTSAVSDDRLSKDPINKYLSRMSRGRLDAETVRDQALSLAGDLSSKMLGPSVYPYQPPGLWQAAFNGDRTWPASEGEDGYRRGLYTFWRRTIPYPSMATFDAPSREICTFRRPNTNTPLQAFVTLNDPVYVRLAQALGRRLVREGGATTQERIRFGLTLCLNRPASDTAVETLTKLFESERTRFAGDALSATTLATEPLGPLPSGLDPAEAAAWTVLGNVLLNLDGVLSRG